MTLSCRLVAHGNNSAQHACISGDLDCAICGTTRFSEVGLFDTVGER